MNITGSQDYGNPRKWGEPGFAAFIVAICCLSSRHIDDPRVRADPNDSNSAGTQWFDLYLRLRTLPGADKPTLYTIQSVFIAGVYAVGLGKLSKAFALLAESVTMSFDAGLHRSSDDYDLFDPIEDEVRKRTFWCVYLWDKQASAHFGRPPMLRLRDCDVGEPTIVDDEFITRDGVGLQPPETESRLSAFVSCVRLFIVLESVIDVPPSRPGDGSPFLARASAVLTGFRRGKELREEEALLDEIARAVPAHWAHSVETMTSNDVIRVTQAERIHCVEQYVRMLIYRHRFSENVAERMHNHVPDSDQGEAEIEAMRAAHSCALQIISSHLHIAAKGLMTYCESYVLPDKIWRVISDDDSCRWCSRYPPVDRGWTHVGCDAAQLSLRLVAAPYSASTGRPTLMRGPFETLQWSLHLRTTIRRPYGRVLPE